MHRRHHNPSDDEHQHKMIEEDETRVQSDVPYQALNDDGNLLVSDDVGGCTHRQVRNEERRGLISQASSSSSSSSSSASSDWSLEGDRNEMKQSLISNAFFFLGSSTQTVLGIYELRSLYDDESGEDDDDADADDDETSNDEWTRQDYILYILGITGTGMYVLNAVNDFVQAKASERSGRGRFGGHPKHELWAAILFGFAAVLETITSIFWTDDRPSPLEANLYMISMHIYFVSGVLSLTVQGLSCSSWCRTVWSCSCCKSSRAMAKLLISLGGIFFLIGCTVDVVMSYLYDPAVANISPTVLAAANLSSSVLWFVDSLLYIAADCMIYSLFRRPIKCFALCVRSKVELPRVITPSVDDNASPKLHV